MVSRWRIQPLAHPPGAELTLEFPRFAVRLQGFTEPMERVGRNPGKPPACRRAIASCANLNDFFTAPTTDLIFMMVSRRVAPANPPGLNRCIPDPQRGLRT